MSLFGYFDRRTGLSSRHRGLMDRQAPTRIGYIYCLGGVTFSLFLAQLLTGLLLSVHYSPAEAEAYNSIRRLHEAVPLGRLLRSTHHWAANLMVATLLLHMLRVFVTASYRNPRELNWIAGVMLFLMTLAFGFTGYLLPWDQKAYWATVVGTNMLGSLPVVGPLLAAFVRGGAEVSGLTLLRFYSIHVLWLPFFTAIFLWVHFHVLRRLGISGGL
jgi:quinol-cytochrome oxidoreductase complex cytochrome b subunit